jgi:PAS domain S-box-containing protein
MMWTEHDQIRKIKKDIYSILDARDSMAFQDFADQLQEATDFLAEMLSNHFYKENNILFPTALKVIGESEWKEVRAQFDELGYCAFTPESATITTEKMEKPILRTETQGMVPFETGNLSREEIESILDTLPVDVTFVDKDDTVRYFSQSKERIFVRTKAVLGRSVQQCHPQKSIHVVNQILEDFKSGKRDVAEFCINFEGKLIHIRYFPVRGKNGEYLGCLEVTQDITNIRKIEKEKRLL